MKHYEDMKQKYNLPESTKLEAYFHVEEEDDKTTVLLEISKKIQEKINTYLNLMEELLNPETISHSHEAGVFDEEEKKVILRIYQKMHYLSRKKLLMDIEYDEESYAGFIDEACKSYESMAEDLKTVLKKVKDSWNRSENKKIALSYFG